MIDEKAMLDVFLAISLCMAAKAILSGVFFVVFDTVSEIFSKGGK